MAEFFNVPLNLPHAATIAGRICQRLSELATEEQDSIALQLASELSRELLPYRAGGDPDPAEAMIVQSYTLDQGRALVAQIQREKLGSDRLGQAIRNLFECLGEGEEGAQLSLLAGEDPDSLQRP